MGFIQSAGELVATTPGAPTNSQVIEPRGITLYPNLVASYEAIYRSQPNIRTVVSFFGKNMAQLTIKLYERLDDTERRRLHDHPLDSMLRRPNHRTSRYSFFRTLVEDLGTFDNFIALKLSDPRTKTRMLIRFAPRLVTVLGNDGLFPTMYRITPPGRPYFDVDYTQVVHLHGYNPSEARWGLSPIESLRRLIAEDAAAGEHREQLWRSGARVPGFIKRPADARKWSEPARDRFRESFRDAYSANGPDAGGLPVLEDGMEYQAANAFTANDLEYLGARKLTKQECAIAYHLNPAILGFGDAMRGDYQSAHRAMLTDAFAPWASWIEEELTAQLIPDFETDADAMDRFYLEFNLQEKLRGDFEVEAEAASRAVGAPWLTRNEYRARQNMPPVPGGDELITPLNVTSGGRASPADTAPGTPGLGQVGADVPGDAGAQAIRAPRAAKALGPAPVGFNPELDAWVEKHRNELAAFVGRQRSAVLSRIGAGETPVQAFGQDDQGRFPRWDVELGDLFGGLALTLGEEAGAPIAERFGIEYNAEVGHAWLLLNSQIEAHYFNAATFAAVSELYPAPTSRAQAVDDTEPVIDDAFAIASGLRAATIAVNRVGTVANFARADAAHQAGATTKTWRSSSDSTRHGALDGVTVAFDHVFANGAAWPHDPGLPLQEAVGCTCLVDFTQAPTTPELVSAPILA
jgi:HK97 family phage portal protein